MSHQTVAETAHTAIACYPYHWLSPDMSASLAGPLHPTSSAVAYTESETSITHVKIWFHLFLVM